jgi:cell division protein FtsZ
MKGARGLLISITGGKDLTLYEVDEAATRIREEVDQEANIIVGATFDEGLEGIIRVSVVATGIDYVATTGRHAETRIAEITQKLRVDSQRVAPERATSQVQPTRASVEQAATAAVAAALDDVSVRPITPKPSLFVEPVMADPAPQDMPKAFIPPQPERVRPRMPRIDELPMPAQNQIRASQGDITETEPLKQRMSLLQRLAQVGLGRRDDGTAAAPKVEPMALPRPPARHVEPVSDYAKRPPMQAPQGLDIHGRPSLPVHKSVDDDQLEIPAFLRRQAN